jgi:hypothetical protein
MEFDNLNEVINIKKNCIASSILQAPNLRSLTINYESEAFYVGYYREDSYDIPETVYSLLPFHTFVSSYT